MLKKGFLVLLLLMTALICRSVEANQVNFQGIGTVELTDDIRVTEAANPNGGKDYKLLVKERDLWRGLRILAAANLPESGALDPVFILNQVLEEKGKAGNVIELEEAKAIAVNGRAGAEAAVKMTVEGWVMNLKLVYLKGPDGIKMMAFACADADTPYWGPIIRKIVASVQ